MRLHGGSPKKPAKRDARTLKLCSLLHKELPAPPDVLLDLPEFPTPMYLNDRYGDCVIAARGHYTLRAEKREQGVIVAITDEEILWEYRNENGHTLDGLELLSSLKAWRRWGWTAGGKQYKCAAFASVDPCNTEHVRQALALIGPLMGGFDLPFSVTRDMDSTTRWDVAKDESAASDPDGGHCIALVGYDELGPLGITWGRRQWMTWAWLEAYCSELYAVVDALDAFRQDHGALDVPALEAYLSELAA